MPGSFSQYSNSAINPETAADDAAFYAKMSVRLMPSGGLYETLYPPSSSSTAKTLGVAMPQFRDPECSITDCEKANMSRGLCRSHYQRYRGLRVSLSMEDFVALGGPTPAEYEEYADQGAETINVTCPTCNGDGYVTHQVESSPMLSEDEITDVLNRSVKN